MSSILSFLKRYFVLVLIVIFVSVFTYYKLSVEPARTAKNLVTYKVDKQTLTQSLTLSGEVNAQEKATLQFQTSGRLAWVGVKEGDYVKKYQSLASLDQRQLEQSLKKSLNTFMNTRWDFDQSKDDNSKSTISDDLNRKMRRLIDKAQFTLDNSIIDVELAALAKEYSVLWTPIEGIVTKIGSPYAGVNTTPSQATFEVVNPATLYLSVLADQTEVTKLTTGQTCTIIFDSYPNEVIYGNIVDISFQPKAGETNTVYEVKISIPESSISRYRLGMTGDAEFIMAQRQDVVAIPQQYITTDAGKKFVYVRKQNTNEKIEVEIGLETDTMVEVIRGLKSGDVLVEMKKS